MSVAEITKDVKSNGRAIYVRGDVLEIDTLQEAKETIRSQFGDVDILINAAGGNHPSATTSADLSFFDLPLDAAQPIGGAITVEPRTIGTGHRIVFQFSAPPAAPVCPR